MAVKILVGNTRRNLLLLFSILLLSPIYTEMINFKPSLFVFDDIDKCYESCGKTLPLESLISMDSSLNYKCKNVFVVPDLDK